MLKKILEKILKEFLNEFQQQPRRIPEEIPVVFCKAIPGGKPEGIPQKVFKKSHVECLMHSWGKFLKKYEYLGGIPEGIRRYHGKNLRTSIFLKKLLV